MLVKLAKKIYNYDYICLIDTTESQQEASLLHAQINTLLDQLEFILIFKQIFRHDTKT